MSAIGTSAILEKVKEARKTAPNVREYFDHKTAARLLEELSDIAERLAVFEPDMEVEKGEN